MKDLRKAAEMALAKLDHLWEIAVDERMNTDVLPEIKALRQALAQPQPVQFKCTVVDDGHPNGVPLSQWGRQPEQEPVAWMYEWNGEKHFTFSDQSFVEKAHPHFNKSIPLYTTPPKREWVGLTEEESIKLLQKAAKHKSPDYCTAPEMAVEFGRLASEALKEKNT